LFVPPTLPWHQLKNPPIVILDEATSALDTITERSVQESLNTLGYNRTVLVIAHRLSTIMNADQILVMDNGEILERGTHEELLQIPEGRYVSLWNKQYRSTVAGAGDSSPVLVDAAVASATEADDSR
jgi:ATP-binding cassette, subfamily B, heavy metal transporter